MHRSCARAFFLVAALLPAAIGALGCGGGEEGVTYQKDVKASFEPCTLCHRPDAPVGPTATGGLTTDILNPYAPDGLVHAGNTWNTPEQPNPELPEVLVSPGAPNDSFLMMKIADPALGLLPPEGAGDPMPPHFEPLSDTQKTSLRTWIQNGAQPDEQFLGEVAPILGAGADNDYAPGRGFPGTCWFCHYPGSPTGLDLSHPFGPEGLVNVRGTYRTDVLRVVPGDPESSFLMTKVGLTGTTSENGAPMPRSFPRLSGEEVERVRQWILAGAKP